MTNQLPTGRFILVEVEPNLHPLRWNTYTGHIKDWPGVVAVTDLAYIDKDDLDARLQRPAPKPVELPERVVQGELLAG